MPPPSQNVDQSRQINQLKRRFHLLILVLLTIGARSLKDDEWHSDDPSHLKPPPEIIRVIGSPRISDSPQGRKAGLALQQLLQQTVGSNTSIDNTFVD